MGRSIGLHRHEFGQDIDQRAARCLDILKTPSQSLKFEIALENAKHEYDLWTEEAALTPNGLALQVQLFELAETYSSARAIIEKMLSLSLAPAVFRNILSEAAAKAISKISIRCGDPIRVSFIDDGQDFEAGSLPQDVWPTLKGHMLLVQKVGLRRIDQFLPPSWPVNDMLPEKAEIEWHGEDAAEIRIG